jgi:hypothetical protein
MGIRDDGGRSDMSYDPINDEKKPFTQEEWATELKEAVDDYVKTFSKEPVNTFHGQTHTFNEWMASFHRYMSW